MRLKLGENLDPRAVDTLRAEGHDMATVQDQRLSGEPDDSVVTACAAEHRCLLILDLDFANVLAYPPERYSGLVAPRHPKPTAAGLLNLIHQLVACLRDHNPSGQLWILEPGRLRIHESTVGPEPER